MRTAHSSSRRGSWTWSPSISPLGVGLDLIPSISPLGVGLDLIPLNSPLSVGLETPPRHREQAPLGAGPPPLWTEFLTHACENITLPKTSFAGSNKTIVSYGNKKMFKYGTAIANSPTSFCSCWGLEHEGLNYVFYQVFISGL